MVVQKFFEYCARSGPESCAMWAGDFSKDTEKRLEDLVRKYEKIVDDPVADPELSMAAAIAQIGIRRTMNGLAYSPLATWSMHAKGLAKLEKVPSPWMKQLRNETERDAETLIDANDPDVPPLVAELLAEFWHGMIVASDNTIRTSYQKYAAVQWREMHEIAPWRADFEATGHGGIFNWPIISQWAFGDKHAIASNVAANPILFASNLIDGVTGLTGARRMNRAFKDSGLLIVDGEGHGSWAAPSLCAAKAVRHYFQTGELPDTSKHCMPAKRPFLGVDGPNTEKIQWEELTKEEQVLFTAVDQKCPTGVHCPRVPRL
ncbi:unnamed protein product [Cercospora beticola]|nr:unnamed protein product [Cercospora beticola]